ncbi:hypothetical protein N657DRAFT_670132 [Parathielavia appendiculata]|uniref:Uncharacterized protein n=1 Tax=Parathielavia appendiculata TaxID=2587402 RepID=A0AAN6U412_9PEZI|nr:hypothetical protein N657DRAFT_670132 [Parathielavia appendiculata]
MHRRLYGLNEIANFVTSLVMQKQGTDIRKRILPHHIFQLQCIVNSLGVYRGWTISSFKGHKVILPPWSFRPRRDVDLFLDRKNERDPNRHRDVHALLEDLQDDFANWLGESRYKLGLAKIPPSRFSNANANGLWEYSPFPFSWNIDAVPDAELPLTSSFFFLRIAKTKQIVDPITHKVRLEVTVIVKRARSEVVLTTPSWRWSRWATASPPPCHVEARAAPGPPAASPTPTYRSARRRELQIQATSPFRPSKNHHRQQAPQRKQSKSAIPGLETFANAKHDLFNDISGTIRPFSSLNLYHRHNLHDDQFVRIEEQLAGRCHRLYVRAYEKDMGCRQTEKLGLALLVMNGGGRRVFEGHGGGVREGEGGDFDAYY